MAQPAARFVGVDIGGTKLHALVADAEGHVFGRARKKVGKDRSFAAVLDRVVSVAREACAEARIELAAVTAVGVGAPSPVLPDGTAVHAPNLGWEQVPLAPTLARMLGRPCVAANDCDAGTFGEVRFGAARGARTAVGLFVGTGLGGGIVVDGQLINGDNHKAAEVGHMIVERDGRRCGCGHRGCLEAYASKTGMANRLARLCEKTGRTTVLADRCEGDWSQLKAGMLADAYGAGDELAVEVIDEAADYLGLGIGNLVTLLGPGIVVLGGGVISALGPALLDRIRAAAASVSWPPSSFEDTRLELAALGDDAVALGAVAWAARSLEPVAGASGAAIC